MTHGGIPLYPYMTQSHQTMYLYGPPKIACIRSVRSRDGSVIRQNFQRFQLPLAPAFAFTDFKCQGRTLQKVAVDLSSRVTGTAAYVMLSRVQRLQDLLILRPFRESNIRYENFTWTLSRA